MKRRKIFLSLAWLSFFLWMTSQALAAEVRGVTKDTVLIGATASLTGPVTTVGVACRDGGQIYFDIINEAGGVHGRKLKVIWEDDGCVPGKGLAAVRRLIDRERVFALFGTNCGNALMAALPVIEKEKIVLLTSIVGVPPVTNPVKPYIFRAGQLPLTESGRALGIAAVEYFKAKKIGILHESGEMGVFFRDNIMKYLNEKKIQPVAVETSNPGDIDYTSQLTRLIEANPDVVLMTLWPKDAAVMIKQAKRLEFKPQWIGAGMTAEEIFAVMAGDAAVGTVHSWVLKCLFDDTHQPMMAKFREEFKKRVGEKPGRPCIADAVSYSGAMVFVEALKRAGRDLTRDKLVEALESIKNFDTLLASPVTFSKTEHQGNHGLNFIVLRPMLRQSLLDIRIEP